MGLKLSGGESCNCHGHYRRPFLSVIIRPLYQLSTGVTIYQMPDRTLAEKLDSILLPFVTPFTDDGDVNHQALKSNIQKWNDTGVTGYVALGSTGERVHLNEREYLSVIETARKEVPDRLTYIAGAGQQSTRGTIEEIHKVADAGADGVLVITPFFYRPALTQLALIDHYRAIADAARIPVILYSMPPLTGIKIEAETVATLSEHENIIGIKDSSNDVATFRRTVELCRSDFAILTGNGTVLRDALMAGARAAILAVGCTAPEICLEIFRAVRSGETTLAAQLQEQLSPLAAAVTTKYGIGGLKIAMEMSGYFGGAVRAPLQRPGQSAQAEIATLLNEARTAFASLIRDHQEIAAS